MKSRATHTWTQRPRSQFRRTKCFPGNCDLRTGYTPKTVQNSSLPFCSIGAQLFTRKETCTERCKHEFWSLRRRAISRVDRVEIFTEPCRPF